MEYRTVVTLIARLLLAVAAILLLLRLLENKFVFFPTKIAASTAPPTIPGARLKDVWIDTADDLKIEGWLIDPLKISASPSPTILYFHGNAGNIEDRAFRWAELVGQGWRVFALDYRGYGRSAGRPDEGGFYLDAEAAYQYLTTKEGIPADQLFVYGESLGSAVAIKLTSEHPVAGVILESPFTSFREMGRAHYPFIPGLVYRFLNNNWDSFSRIRYVSSPKFFIHGDQDGIVPYEQGQRLFQAALPPKYFYTVRGGDHNDSIELGGPALWAQMNAFIRENFHPQTSPDDGSGHTTPMEK